jgi:hypothetical protein
VAERHDLRGVEDVDAAALLAQAGGDPGELGEVGGGLIADDDGDDGGLLLRGEGGEGEVELLEEAVLGADDVRAVAIVEAIEEGGEAEAAGDGVDFREREAVLSYEEVGPEDDGKFVFIYRVALVVDEALGLATVEVAGDPGGKELAIAQEIFALPGAGVEELEGLEEGEAALANAVELGDLGGGKGPGRGGELPGLVLEERLAGEGVAQGGVIERRHE